MTLMEVIEVLKSGHPLGAFDSLVIHANGSATAVIGMGIHRFSSLEELQTCAEIIAEREGLKPSSQLVKTEED